VELSRKTKRRKQTTKAVDVERETQAGREPQPQTNTCRHNSTLSTGINPLQPFFMTPHSIIPFVHDRSDDPSTCIIHKSRQGPPAHVTYHHGPQIGRLVHLKRPAGTARTKGGLPPMGHLHSRRCGGGHRCPPFLDRNVLHRVHYPNRTIIRFKKKKKKKKKAHCFRFVNRMIFLAS
jgi:hypothetical protein